jgi:hypothetical protein
MNLDVRYARFHECQLQANNVLHITLAKDLRYRQYKQYKQYNR